MVPGGDEQVNEGHNLGNRGGAVRVTIRGFCPCKAQWIIAIVVWIGRLLCILHRMILGSGYVQQPFK